MDKSLTGDIEAAIHTIERVVKVHPDNVSALLNLGYLNEEAGRPARAEEWFAAAVRAAPSHTLARAELQRVRAARPDGR